MSRNTWLLCGLAVFACASTGFSADQEPESQKAAAPRDALTQKQIAAYRSELQRILTKQPREFTPKSGGTGVELIGYEHVALAKATEDGEIVRLCTDDVETAISFLRTPAVSQKDR